MKKTSVTYAKNHLSAVLDEVRAGETFMILDRGDPVARLEPIGARSDPLGRIGRLARAGLARPAEVRDLLGALDASPAAHPGQGAVEALVEERRVGR